MAEHIKIYEEKKSASIWLWLLPLLLLLAILAFFLFRHHPEPAASTAAVPAAATANSGLPDIGTIHFATDSATLTPEGKATLDRAAAVMKSNPNAHLRVEGFTDSTGTVATNDVLSQQRAAAAADYLKGQGIDGSRLTGAGFGPADAKDTNATATGRADNRRTELFLGK